MADRGRRVAAIRNHVVPLVRMRGQRHWYGRLGECRPACLTTWNSGPFSFVLRMPLETVGEAPPRGDAAPPPYGLDVWRGRRVLSVAWGAGGEPLDVVGFRSGTWEAEVLGLA